MQTTYDLAQSVTVPRRDDTGEITHRLTGSVVGIAISADLGERCRVQFVDEAGHLQSLEYAAAELAAA